MKQRVVALLLAAGCAVFGVIGIFVYTGQDHVAPKITVKKESISYTEGEDYEVLMKGVTARDNIDGDITKEVFVDKIVQTTQGKAVVYYGVMDKKQNVGTARRSISYTPSESKEKFVDTEEDKSRKEAEKQETDKEKADKEKEDKKNEEAQKELKPDGKRPAMALNETKVTVKAGETFDPLSIVRDAVDDKDDRNTLYQHIHADGKYDTKKKGTYEIRYYVSDSDGNTSEPQIVTLTVE